MPKDLLKGKGSITNKILHDLSKRGTGVLIEFLKSFVKKFGGFEPFVVAFFVGKREMGVYKSVNSTTTFISHH